MKRDCRRVDYVHMIYEYSVILLEMKLDDGIVLVSLSLSLSFSLRRILG